MLMLLLFALQGATSDPAKCPSVQTPKGPVIVCDGEDLSKNYRLPPGLAPASRKIPPRPTRLTDADLLRLQKQPVDKTKADRREVLGLHGRGKVVANYICGDVCPDYTVRIIHYDADPSTECAKVGGIVRPRLVPRGRTILKENFCVPRVFSWWEVMR